MAFKHSFSYSQVRLIKWAVWMRGRGSPVIKIKQYVNSSSWVAMPHFKCSTATCGLWLPVQTVHTEDISITGESSIGQHWSTKICSQRDDDNDNKEFPVPVKMAGLENVTRMVLESLGIPSLIHPVLDYALPSASQALLQLKASLSFKISSSKASPRTVLSQTVLVYVFIALITALGLIQLIIYPSTSSIRLWPI